MSVPVCLFNNCVFQVVRLSILFLSRLSSPAFSLCRTLIASGVKGVKAHGSRVSRLTELAFAESSRRNSPIAVRNGTARLSIKQLSRAGIGLTSGQDRYRNIQC